MPAIRKTNKKHKSQRKPNKRNKMRKSSTRKMRGGCGCNQMAGGNGGHGLAELPLDKYYPVSPDNQLENANQSSRIIGGKTCRWKRMAGGNAPVNAVSSFGNSTSLSNINSLLTNSSSVDSSVTVQPASSMYNKHVSPLV
jgi:hypothetical protein